MEPFKKLATLAAILDRQNIDTDQIIPNQFLKKIERTGFGKHLFHATLTKRKPGRTRILFSTLPATRGPGSW